MYKRENKYRMESLKMTKAYLSLLVSIFAIISISACSPNKVETTNNTPVQRDDLLTKQNTTFIVSLIEKSAPPVLNDEILASKGDISKWIWFDNLQTWTDEFIRLTGSRQFIDNDSKDVIVSALKKYYTTSKAEDIFSFYFKKKDDGTYESIETERFPRTLQGIQEDLKVNIQKKSESNTSVLFEGFGYDYFDFKEKQKDMVKIQFSLIKEKDNYFISDIIDLD
ncbi:MULTISPECIES: hypothetical protein [Brevibacillus]|uniref:hypothetical protein n=1 Tax=Brevibacillus TaxID=55080 RepID=UPI001FE28A46|nr:hypothetical protein [Brevibacillus halotolerans]